MGRAKEIILKIIPSKMGNDFIRKHHYSGKSAPNSPLHFGCFLDNNLHGVISYGSSLRKDLIQNLVKNTGWNEFLELNRMAFDEYLPRNSESRCIAMSIRMIKKNAPHIKWIISFADASQCGDGTIYRASGFKLTGIKKNTQLAINPYTNKVEHKISAFHNGLEYEFKNWKKVNGYQLRYIYLIHKDCILNVPEISFDKIDSFNAGMYKGKKISLNARKLSGVVESNANSQLDVECVTTTLTPLISNTNINKKAQ